MPGKTLLKDFDSGLKAPLYYLWSDEGCFLDEALSRFVEVVIASDPVDFNYDVFDSSAGPQEILNAALTLPFMAPRRLVVIRDFNKFPASSVKALTPYFKQPSETTCMVVFSMKAPKASLKVGWNVYSLDIKERDMPLWLKRAALKKGIKLTGDAVDSLIEFVGYDAGLLLMELEKFRDSGSGTVTGGDVRASTSMMKEYTPFDLINSLIAGQKTRVFRILKTMFSRNAMDAPVILGTLNWHYKQFYSLWQNKGRKPFKMREGTYRALKKYLPSFDEERFYRIFRSLHEADLGIKTSGRPGLEIEVLLIKLLQGGAGN